MKKFDKKPQVNIIENNLISMNKKYRMKNGRKVRIICTDAKDVFKVIALAVGDNGEEIIRRYTSTGIYFDRTSESSRNYDLVEIKNIPDKTLVRCWNSDDDCIRHERFYDALNDCTFTKNGDRNGKAYENYEIIKPEPKWAKEKKEKLKDMEIINFDEEKILQKATVINCKTKEEAIKLLTWADSIGFTWFNGKSFVDNYNWDKHKENTCYDLWNGEGVYSDIKYFKEHEVVKYLILDFNDIVI